MRSAAWLLVALVLAACAAQPPAAPGSGATAAAVPNLNMSAVSFSALPGWADDHLSAAIPPLQQECALLAGLPAGAALGGDADAARLGGQAGQWRPLCAAAAAVPAGDDAAARAMLERELQPYTLIDNGRPDGLFTGYYEPQVDGAMTRGGRYRTPLLRRPRDLVQVDAGADPKGHAISGRMVGGRLVPYYDRAAIEHGALAAQHLELVFLADPVDAFFLEIQGAGRVRLPDGRIHRVS
jgi:membrane-bound lytic murein transglycosylase A